MRQASLLMLAHVGRHLPQLACNGCSFLISRLRLYTPKDIKEPM
jgi:hypothetical protein